MIKRHSRLAIFAFLALVSVFVAAQQTQFALKSGDRIVFFGDSITEQRLYTSYVQQFVISRYPDLNVTFINSGWSGDTVHDNPCVPCAGVGALARIQRDVVAYEPTVVTLLFGMNDGLYKDFDPEVMKAYTDGLSRIIRILKQETHARIYVMTPTVYDRDVKTSWSHTDDYNAVLDRYSEAAKEIARRENLTVIDLHKATTGALEAAKKADKNYTFFGVDGVHPAPEGHAVMAAEIVRMWGAPEKGIVFKANVELKGMKATVSVSAPLPWPPVKLTSQIQQADPNVAKVGSVTLILKSLPSGSYAMSVDGKSVGSFTSQQLDTEGTIVSAEFELAQKEAADLGKAVRDKEDLEFMRWRTFPTRFGGLKSTPEAQAVLQKMVEEQYARAREKAKLHKYEITLTRQEAK